MKKVFKIYDNQNLINTKHYIERDYLPTTLTLMVAVSLPFSLDKTTLYLPESDFSAALLNSLISVGVFSKLNRPPCDRGLPPYWKNVVMLIHVIASVSLFSCYLFKGTFSLEINVWNITYHRPVRFRCGIAIIRNNNLELFPFLDSDVSWNEVGTDFRSNCKSTIHVL